MPTRTIPAPMITPATSMNGVTGYRLQSFVQPIDLRLDTNEGPPASDALDSPQLDPSVLRHYREARELDARLASLLGVEADRVLATAGGDDAIERLCRAFLEPGRALLQHTPTFGMIERSARLADGEIVSVPWCEGRFPIDEFAGAITNRIAIVALVSPNNPTGLEIEFDDVRRVLERAADIGAVVMIDLAYAEFAETDPTHELLESPNVVIVRTLSKAWGLAGLRVGYLAGPPSIVGACRDAGGAFAVSSPSISLALQRLDQAPPTEYVDAVKRNRTDLSRLLLDLGARPTPSGANFVLAEFDDPSWVHDALAGLGIAVRNFGDPELRRSLRISCPGNDADFARLTHALRAAIAPESILFDLDGVLADVSHSYRLAIARTAASYGVILEAEEIAWAKRQGDANNDWVLTQRLLSDQRVEVPLGEITERFEAIYQGDGRSPGLRETEALIPARAVLESLASRLPLGIVTGRPRADAQRFLERMKITNLFQSLVCMEDGPPKPDPGVVGSALDGLNASRAWLIGDTVDDVVAARAAGVVPLGVMAPGDAPRLCRDALLRAGAARVLRSIESIEELLP